MRTILRNETLAGQTWTAATSGRVYPIDAQGLASIFDDNPDKGTGDRSEAEAAGFTAYDPGQRVAMKNPDYAKRRVPREVGGDVEMVDIDARGFVATKTNHHYHADDEGRIEFFAVDVEEAAAAGFAAA